MATFEPRLDSIDSLSYDLQRLGQLNQYVVWRMLTLAAELLKRLFREKIQTTFQRHTGILAASIKIFPKMGDEPYILVYPYGPHHKYNNKKAYKRAWQKRRAKPAKTATASEVAFVLEYGSSRHKATHWMENTMNEHAAEIAEELQKGFDAVCDEMGIGS